MVRSLRKSDRKVGASNRGKLTNSFQTPDACPIAHMKSPVRFILILVTLGTISVVALNHERGNHRRLIREVEIAQREAMTADKLRSENERLRALQVPSAELDRLRADHAALVRLRAELEDLRKRAPAVSP